MIACDLGSNTFRVVQIDCESTERIKEFEKIVKTAEGIAGTGLISESAMQRVIEAIHEAKAEFDLTDARAVATAAMRKAANRTDVLRRIYEETGLEFEIIDAAKEAYFTKIAVKNRLRLASMESNSFLLMDLGGGSTELIFEDFDQSFQVGIVTIVDQYSLEGIYEGIKKEFLPIQSYAKEIYTKIDKPDTFIATAGTPTTIAAFLQGMDYAHYDYKKINGTMITLEEMQRALDRLLAMPTVERVRWVGVGRDDLIIAGIVMFSEIVRIFGFEKVLVIDDGLREGVALDMCR